MFRPSRRLFVTGLLLGSGAMAAALGAGCGDGDGGRGRDNPISVRVASTAASVDAPRTIVVAAVGDVMLGRGVGEAIGEHGVEAPFGEAGALLQRADIAFANLEVALTDRGSPAPKDFTFRAPPRYADALVGAGLDVVSLANNHVLDYGPLGLEDTLAALKARGLVASGAGVDLEAALRPATLEVAGMTVAVLAFANFDDDSVSGFRATTFAAGASAPGVAWATPDSVRRAAERAAAAHDIVIVSMHWGHEFRDDVADEQRELAYAAIDAGAQLVLGHGPHVIQGWERRGRGLIVYSLGNFVFDLDEYDRAYEGLPSTLTLVFEAEIGPQGVEAARYTPVQIDELTGFPVLASGAAADRVRERAARLCPSISEAMASLGSGDD